jgi:hypothetical protein
VQHIDKVEKEGFVVELDGKFFGILYQDDHLTTYGFAGIETAIVYEDKHTLGPVGLVPEGSPHYADLARSKYAKIRKTETFERFPEPIVITQVMKDKLAAVFKLKVQLPGCMPNPDWMLPVQDLLLYMVSERIDLLPAMKLNIPFHRFRSEDKNTLEYYLRSWLVEHHADYEYINRSQVSDHFLKLLTDTGVFEVTMATEVLSHKDNVLRRCTDKKQTRVYQKSVPCLRIVLELSEE